MRAHPYIATALLVLGLAACHKSTPEPSPEVKTPRRTDFTRDEFGIGRPHTGSARCNREIDRLLDQIRLCVNDNPAAGCETLQDTNNKRIARLKNALHCRR